MPTTEVLFYQEEDGTVPLIQWLQGLQAKALEKCLARLLRLEELGHELRRPEGDYLRDDIYELRASLQGVHYRMLYFFHGTTAAIVSHGLVKERAVPPKEINLATDRKNDLPLIRNDTRFDPEVLDNGDQEKNEISRIAICV